MFSTSLWHPLNCCCCCGCIARYSSFSDDVAGPLGSETDSGAAWVTLGDGTAEVVDGRLVLTPAVDPVDSFIQVGAPITCCPGTVSIDIVGGVSFPDADGSFAGWIAILPPGEVWYESGVGYYEGWGAALLVVGVPTLYVTGVGSPVEIPLDIPADWYTNFPQQPLHIVMTLTESGTLTVGMDGFLLGTTELGAPPEGWVASMGSVIIDAAAPMEYDSYRVQCGDLFTVLDWEPIPTHFADFGDDPDGPLSPTTDDGFAWIESTVSAATVTDGVLSVDTDNIYGMIGTTSLCGTTYLDVTGGDFDNDSGSSTGMIAFLSAGANPSSFTGWGFTFTIESQNVLRLRIGEWNAPYEVITLPDSWTDSPPLMPVRMVFVMTETGSLTVGVDGHILGTWELGAPPAGWVASIGGFNDLGLPAGWDSYELGCGNLLTELEWITVPLPTPDPPAAPVDQGNLAFSLANTYATAAAQPTVWGKYLQGLFAMGSVFAGGSVHAGYGDWLENTGPVTMLVQTIFGPSTTSPALQTECTAFAREIDGAWFVPSIDPVATDTFLYRRTTNTGPWDEITIPPMIHCFDVARDPVSGRYFVCGAAHGSHLETVVASDTADPTGTWSVVYEETGGAWARSYWLCEHNGALYAGSSIARDGHRYAMRWDGAAFVADDDFIIRSQYAWKPTALSNGMIAYLSSPNASRQNASLLIAKDDASVVSVAIVHDFCVDAAGAIWAATTDGRVMKGTPVVGNITWDEWTIAGSVTTEIITLDVDDGGLLFVGCADSTLHYASP